MAEWLVEEGIGEHRALLVENGQALAARIDWPGENLSPGEVAEAILIARQKGSSRGRARFASGEEALVERLPQSASEGAPIRLVVTRPAMGEGARQKLAHARPASEAVRPAPSLTDRLGAKVVRRLPPGLWEEVWSEAWEGQVAFPSGSLIVSPTPAMTLVDVDGQLRPRELALAAIEPLAATISRMGLSGSIGIDFPTLTDKADRKKVDGALAAALADWDHERTAMNGFGFVQLVSQVEIPSLLHRFTFTRARAAARLLLRRAEQLEGPGTTQLVMHPALKPLVDPQAVDELRRRTGREVDIGTDPALALEAGSAQIVS